jgi:hypothetical protein
LARPARPRPLTSMHLSRAPKTHGKLDEIIDQLLIHIAE